MIFVDTSAWIEFLRDTGSEVCEQVDVLLEGEIAICDAISMEVLAGAKDDRHLEQLRRLLARATIVPTTPLDFDDAALLSILSTQGRDGPKAHRLPDCDSGNQD